MLTLGQNAWHVAAQLGHKDVEMVFRTHGRFIREDYQQPKPEWRNVEKIIGAQSVRISGHHGTPQEKKKPPHTLILGVWRCLEWAGVN